MYTEAAQHIVGRPFFWGLTCVQPERYVKSGLKQHGETEDLVFAAFF